MIRANFFALFPGSRLVTEEVTAVIHLHPWRGTAEITEVIGCFFVVDVILSSNSKDKEEKGFKKLLPVGQFQASHRGYMDMLG